MTEPILATINTLEHARLLRVKIEQGEKDLAQSGSYLKAQTLQRLRREYKELFKARREAIYVAYDFHEDLLGRVVCSTQS